MIQDISPHVYRNEYTPCPPEPDDIVFSFQDDLVILKENNCFFSVKDLPEGRSCQYLFTIDSTSFFLADLLDLPHSSMPSRAMRAYDPKYLGFAAVTAWQLYLWYRDTTFCGRCGSRMIHSQTERAMTCPDCGNIVYPRIMPAVIVGVLNRNGQILVTKFAHSTYIHYALISGFGEIGESIEETVRREVKEECGVDTENFRYYKSQPWSFSSTLLLGFFCDVKGSDQIRMDENELSVARWADRNEDIGRSDEISLTSEMIQYYKDGHAVFGKELSKKTRRSKIRQGSGYPLK
ncbi:MAG: NAD(+) diphosphatase [Solobacterium sp.]|nr:NAD(+) diphosphatase [Solobacterium sp.]